IFHEQRGRVRPAPHASVRPAADRPLLQRWYARRLYTPLSGVEATPGRGVLVRTEGSKRSPASPSQSRSAWRSTTSCEMRALRSPRWGLLSSRPRFVQEVKFYKDVVMQTGVRQL